ncbi:hypothetical protein EDC01DRAFT_672587 [Geopyxis carbonaria]|nr:hypothetical protein EDC01DRAFT_672587 [Geopyxis carbonaria]
MAVLTAITTHLYILCYAVCVSYPPHRRGLPDTQIHWITQLTIKAIPRILSHDNAFNLSFTHSKLWKDNSLNVSSKYGASRR